MNAYPIDNVWRKGHYVARVTGPHPKYVVDREFLTGTPIKTRQTVEYGPGDIGTLPAWIIRTPEETCGGCGRPKPETGTELIAADEHGWQSYGYLPAAAIVTVFEAGAPGAPDAWTGERCTGCHERPVFDAERCEKCAAGADALAAITDKETPF